MKILLFIFSILLILLLARLWVGTGSYPDRWRTQERAIIQKSANEKKQAQIDKIQAELNDAKSGNDAIEERARSELGMTKKGETYFEIILQPEEKKTETNVSPHKTQSTKQSTKQSTENKATEEK